MIISADGRKREEIQEELTPIRVVDSCGVDYAENLTISLPGCVPFGLPRNYSGWPCFQGKGSFVLLDFGRELCGGIRMIVKGCHNPTKWRLTFGESLTEACSHIGEKNSGNDHSPRDFEIITCNMSDLTFGQTGFRFVRLELLEETPAAVQNIFAVSHLPCFHAEAHIITNDVLLNNIIETAIYTLKLTFQNGYIWDGIKRDRLVWCGDLHPEVLTSLYVFGDNDNIKNSLSFLKNNTSPGGWVNTIPAYSAWWVINLCEYYTFTGNEPFFEQNKEYAIKILKKFDDCIKENGEVVLTDGFGMEYYLDWPSFDHPDAPVGVAALLRWMAQKFIAIEENAYCRNIIRKLQPNVEKNTVMKQVRALQILAGRTHSKEDVDMLQNGGAKGLSTFMSYYILSAMASAGGTEMLSILKNYYGGMLSRGATSFWEDFDVEWLENSGRIDAFPEEGQKDIHGDFGRHCYQQFRHSLCHGWSVGVLSFIIEYIVGVHITNGGETVYFNPHRLGLDTINATLPMKNGAITVSIDGEKQMISVPDGVKVMKLL